MGLEMFIDNTQFWLALGTTNMGGFIWLIIEVALIVMSQTMAIFDTISEP